MGPCLALGKMQLTTGIVMLGRGSLFLSQLYGDIFMGILKHALQDLRKLPFTSVLASQVLMFSKACPVFLVYPVCPFSPVCPAYPACPIFPV